MARDLDLTAEQQGQIRTLLDAEWTKNAPLRQKMQDSREQLHRTAEKTPFDEAVVRKLASEQEKTHVDLIVSRTRAMNQVYAPSDPRAEGKGRQTRSLRNGVGQGTSRLPREITPKRRPSPSEAGATDAAVAGAPCPGNRFALI